MINETNSYFLQNHKDFHIYVFPSVLTYRISIRYEIGFYPTYLDSKLDLNSFMYAGKRQETSKR